MNKFEFYDTFKELANIQGIEAGDSRIDKLVSFPESCIGHRKVGNRTYHIFYLKPTRFAVYYHGGGVDSMYADKSLDTVLEYVNHLVPVEDL